MRSGCLLVLVVSVWGCGGGAATGPDASGSGGAAGGAGAGGASGGAGAGGASGGAGGMAGMAGSAAGSAGRGRNDRRASRRCRSRRTGRSRWCRRRQRRRRPGRQRRHPTTVYRRPRDGCGQRLLHVQRRDAQEARRSMSVAVRHGHGVAIDRRHILPGLNQCQMFSDCTARPHGYCQAGFLNRPNTCHYACATDADCDAGQNLRLRAHPRRVRGLGLPLGRGLWAGTSMRRIRLDDDSDENLRSLAPRRARLPDAGR